MSQLETGVKTFLVDNVKWLPKGKPTWKMVDLEHADSVASGVLRIGTLTSYADLENGRADAAEGTLVIDSGLIELADTSNPEMMRRALRAGVEVQPGARNIRIEHHTIVDSLVPTWAFCMADAGCDFDWTPDKPKAIFEISDPYALARAIAAHIGVVSGNYSPPGYVEYLPTAVDMTEGIDRFVSPFVKEPKFAQEREVRIVFNSNLGPSENIEPFFLPASSAVAALLTRTR